MTTRKRLQHGFSLTEVLLALATLTVGMVFVGGTFFVGVHYSARSFEQNLGAVVAREAVEMIRLYGITGLGGAMDTFSNVRVRHPDPNEDAELARTLFVYDENPQFRWNALLQRRAGGLGNQVDVTVFVSRWNEHDDPDHPPVLRNLSLDVVEGRFIDTAQSDAEHLYHGQQVVGGRDSRWIFKVVRSRTDSPKPGFWELVPEPSQIDPSLSGDYTLPIWAVIRNENGRPGIQSRIVHVMKDQIEF